MAKLPDVTAKQVVSVLMKFGFYEKSMKGSHKKLVYQNKTVIVPIHKRVGKGLLKSILRQAGITDEEFIELLKK